MITLIIVTASFSGLMGLLFVAALTSKPQDRRSNLSYKTLHPDYVEVGKHPKPWH
jgi:hypothetical protein